MHTNLEQVLQDHFHLPSFRPGQKEIIERILAGESVLGLMPTGSGKSLTYQMFSTLSEGLTLCVTPLIALMEDQSAKAMENKLNAGFIHSQVSAEDKQKRLARLENGDYRLFFATPERLQKPEFQKAISQLKISLLVVDEAHCISLWGHDFRPDYANIGKFRKQFGNPPVLALTATATPDVQKEITGSLEIPEDAIVSTGFKRSNIAVQMKEVYGMEAKIEALSLELANLKGSCLVYVTLIRTAEEVLRELRKKGFDPLIYHGDLPPQKRKAHLKAFMRNENAMMVATPAFGLGIDKPNIRGVFHLEPTSSLENFYQEIGRAGRDGHLSKAIFYYDEEDLTIPMQFIKSAHPEKAFIEKVFDLINTYPDRVLVNGSEFITEQISFKNKSDHRISSALGILERWGCISRKDDKIQKLKDLDPQFFEVENQEVLMKHHNLKLYALVKWIRDTETCRLVQIYNYFGVQNSQPCGQCDNCEGEGIKQV